jgi:hypothetical protein
MGAAEGCELIDLYSYICSLAVVIKADSVNLTSLEFGRIAFERA